jgi:hypothetical protein
MKWKSPNLLTLLERASIRDTKTHNAPEMLFLGSAKHWGFVINNDTDQTCHIELIGGNVSEPAACGLIGKSGDIQPRTQEPIIVEGIWALYLGIRFNFPLAPTTGAIEIEGSIYEEKQSDS